MYSIGSAEFAAIRDDVFLSKRQRAMDRHERERAWFANWRSRIDDDAAITRAIRRHYPYIFEQESTAWCGDAKAWPRRRDYRTFKNWFDVKVSSMVLDLSKRHFEVEEYED